MEASRGNIAIGYGPRSLTRSDKLLRLKCVVIQYIMQLISEPYYIKFQFNTWFRGNRFRQRSSAVSGLAIVGRRGPALHPVVPDDTRNPQSIVRHNAVPPGALRRAVLFEIAPLSDRGFVAPE